MKRLKVLFVAAEAAGLVKVGGLGDVAGELPVKLGELGADVRLVIPCYQDIEAPSRYVSDFPVRFGSGEETCIVRETQGTPVKTFLIGNDRFFGRPGIYGHNDDAERFAFFCLAVYAFLKNTDFKPDVIHLNDWHTAPLAMLISHGRERDAFLQKCAVIYTIHSLAYQGVCGWDIFKLYNLPDSEFVSEKVEFFGAFNPMKAGIRYSDRITAVSETGVREMLTKECGFGLDGFLACRKERISGIINGLDDSKWDPAADTAIDFRYSASNPEMKAANKEKLMTELGLGPSDEPLLGVVSRLDEVKGIELLIPVIESIAGEGGRIIVLGKGDLNYEQALMKLHEKYPERIYVRIAFDGRLARRIYAASDMFLMPSRYEPCGLSQLIAMRYGTIPVVRRVGGLADTVVDESRHAGQGIGFAFDTYSSRAFIRAVRKGIKLYKSDRNRWNELVGRAMARDSSWEKPAKAYLELYGEAIKAKRKRSAPKAISPSGNGAPLNHKLI